MAGKRRKLKSDIEIARAASLKPIEAVAKAFGNPDPGRHLYRYGPYKAKISFEFIDSLADRPDGKLILVTAITPTPAGEGKTTTTVGLGDALNRIGKKAMICLREPSLGPCFGVKGGATGGGYSQVVPMEDINLHFTGDIHAVGAAHNLLAALIDNHIYWGNELELDPRRILWRRVMDINDRALRNIVVSLGGIANGFPREDGFGITAASEVMAIFCLAESVADLRDRLGNIIVGQNRRCEWVLARDLKAEGPMTALLRDALMPNLVQSLENNPAFIHGGPFANIAHGCNSVIATRTALKLADYVITEAGFGADLGAEKFFDIKCRKAGFKPGAGVLVVTVRALKMHGGVARGELGRENLDAVRKGRENLVQQVRNLRAFGVPVVVAVNRFDADTEAELALIEEMCAEIEVEAVVCAHWADGSAGAEALARTVVALVESAPSEFRFLYPDDMALWDKARTIARTMYGARDIIADQKTRDQFAEFEKAGYGHYPICMAKTQYSLSTDPTLKGAPSDHVVPIRELRLAGGAEFLVAICGEVMTMPGLPRVPAANSISVNDAGFIEGLF